ncbi:predicted protein [Plenodomus lingam JN3]|uniref:Predicted protein n=1 Tax=Leptosphaeria maculans (strain JN3 / isolate v23.1.3 / race Av1-4-5-6-7-8) TaxID=985895 RepID=E4ZQY1_LEPMJ|nr:predicted protein [Plenodomus lingam JN3]CBX93646.1 predicted protein [Plenodomus lingam JN3]
MTTTDRILSNKHSRQASAHDQILEVLLSQLDGSQIVPALSGSYGSLRTISTKGISLQGRSS